MAFQKAFITLAIILFAMPLLSHGQEGTKVDFVKDIKPIFEANCMSCHNEDNDKGGFLMDDRDEILDSWVYAEEADESPLITDHLETDDEDFMMPPPKDHKNWEEGHAFGPLGAADVAIIKTWINEGADWPEDVKLVVPSDEELAENGAAAVAPNPNLWNAIGSLHPAAIHLPLGLLLAAGLFALLGLRGNFVMSDCAYYCLWFGTIFAIIGCATGWYYSDMKNVGSVSEFQDLFNEEQKVYWHRLTALITTVVAFLLCLFAAGARNRDPDDGFLWKLGCIILAGGIGYVGHAGGELQYGKAHYRDLENSVEAVTSIDVNGDGVVAEWGERLDGKPAEKEEMDKEPKSDEDSKDDEKMKDPKPADLEGVLEDEV